MIDAITATVLALCIVMVVCATFICAATIAVASPWWPHSRRSRYRSSSGKIHPGSVLCRTIEAFALTSPHTVPRARDISRRNSTLEDNQSLPLRFQPERLYGSLSPHNTSARSSITSFSHVDGGSSRKTITTIGGFLAPPNMRPRSGSTSLLHDLAKQEYKEISPIPAFMMTVNTQPLQQQPQQPQQDHLQLPQPTTERCHPQTQERRKSLRIARRTTLGSLSPRPITNELGASLTELVSMLGTQVSRSTHNSPSSRWKHSLTPTTTPPMSQLSPLARFSIAEAPGGTINCRIFIDATGKDNITARVHLYSAANLPAIRPWKNSNYIVKAALIGFKSHFVQTSGAVTAACGSPRFSEGSPSILDFVLDCGMPFNKSEEEILLKLMIIEFVGRKPGDKAVLVATKEFRFSHHTLKGKSTMSVDINFERCKSCIDVSYYLILINYF